MKILIVPNNPGWAFDHRAKDLLSQPFEEIELYLKYAGQVKETDQFEYDLIYPMSLSIAKKIKKLKIPFHKMATGITSLRVFEKHVNNHEINKNFIDFLKSFRGINTASNQIQNIFKPYLSIHKTRVGINENLFKPNPKQGKNYSFNVGWVGRIDKKNYRELKGYNIVEKAIRKVKKIHFETRTYTSRVPREKMVSYYQELDCFICSSKSEHIPLPILEAASCGVPIISTKVGIVPELINHKKNGLIIPRNSDDIAYSIKLLQKNPNMRKKFSKNIRNTIVNGWTWDICKREWETFFLSMK
ncbi:glycosyltransferase family 4 protein [Evansella tamaricis]|uniref:Glycosyltransferase family 4 protein n=1 Tax=Evansella tamaricis TaxID=2069301 RepID=A0ABS6JI15_9BACI|nr:glycosyltransferase family 4 protein [Evansella tamaricis]MBU9713311.1 glycosyltransferase family 4 protein [Evansella tamaricis]